MGEGGHRQLHRRRPRPRREASVGEMQAEAGQSQRRIPPRILCSAKGKTKEPLLKGKN